MSSIRLDKFLALMGVGTRSEVKKILKTGNVTVNGAAEKRPETKIDAAKDEVICQGKPLHYQPFLCLMLYKPSGCITATSDRYQKTVMDYISHERKGELFPAGRLDIDTEGLLLLMNDGSLAHRMLSPGRHVEKTYFVRADGRITDADVLAFEQGIDIGEKRKTLPARLKLLGDDGGREAEITICEGKYHQIKRMFEARGKKVCYLKRVSMAGITLDEHLLPGEWRELTKEETERLRSLLC